MVSIFGVAEPAVEERSNRLAWVFLDESTNAIDCQSLQKREEDTSKKSVCCK